METGFFDQQVDQLTNLLKQGARIKDISTEFARLTTDEDRVAYVLKLPAIHQTLQVPALTDTKSAEVSKDWRIKGNKAFQAKDYTGALKLYMKSVCSAPCEKNPDDKAVPNNAELALAYANRSAALFHLQKFKDCLKDIDSAILNQYPEELKYKLFDRKGKCLLELGEPAEAGGNFKKAIERLAGAQLDNKRRNAWEADLKKEIDHCSKVRQKPESTASATAEEQLDCDCSLPKLALGTNATFLSLSSACEVVYTPEQGRYICAKQEIKPGEVISVEKPFASVLLPDVGTDHCHHCFTHTMAPLPCSSCSSAIYCSERCQQESWETYHATECPILSTLFKSGVGKFGYLALRTVMKASLKQLLLLKKERDTSSCAVQDKCLEGCNDHGKYVSNDYNTIYHLVTHDKDRTADDLFNRATKAVFLLKCLQKMTFFEEGGANFQDSPENEAFIGGLLLSHLQSFPCNAHEISELQLDKDSVAVSEPLEIGAGIYSTLSLFNHSCDPAVNRNFHGDICVVRAIKLIKPGEEISDNYGAVYAVQSKAQRHQKLKPQYFFDCRCEPCLKDWPLYPEIESTNPKWNCKNCTKPLTLNAAKPPRNEAKCSNCGTSQNLAANDLALQASSQQYQEGFQQLLDCHINDALPRLLHHLERMQHLVALPWQEFNNCQEAVKQCFSIMGNCRVIK